jgi:hypothetical protein
MHEEREPKPIADEPNGQLNSTALVLVSPKPPMPKNSVVISIFLYRTLEKFRSRISPDGRNFRCRASTLLYIDT